MGRGKGRRGEEQQSHDQMKVCEATSPTALQNSSLVYLLIMSKNDKRGLFLRDLLLPLVRRLQNYKTLTFPLEYCLLSLDPPSCKNLEILGLNFLMPMLLLLLYMITIP